MSKKSNDVNGLLVFSGIIMFCVALVYAIVIILLYFIIFVLKLFGITYYKNEFLLGNDDKEKLRKIDACEGHEFEMIVADILKSNGYTDVRITKGSGDYGADIIAIKDERKYAIQCKRYDKKIGPQPIGEVLRGMNKYKCSNGAIITNSTFTNQAKDESKINNVELWDRGELIRLIENTHNDLDNSTAAKIKRFMCKNYIQIVMTIIAIIIISAFLLIAHAIKKEINRQNTEVGYNYSEYVDLVKEKIKNGTYSEKIKITGIYPGGRFYIASTDNEYNDEMIKSISKEVYEECKGIHYKRQGVFDDDHTNITIIFERFDVKRENTVTTRETSYMIYFSSIDAENEKSFEEAVHIEKYED